jgi:hypothetical protein
MFMQKSYSGFQAEAYDDGYEFLAVAQKNRPDCVVTDLHMPKMPGMQLLLQVSVQPSSRSPGPGVHLRQACCSWQHGWHTGRRRMQNAPRMPAIRDDHQQHQREHNPAKNGQHHGVPQELL